MILLSGPAIANLHLHTRKWAHAHLRAGSFGPVVEVGGVLFASLAGVEAHAGEAFTPDQVIAAAAGKPGRILTIPAEAAAE